ncbi:hypothetical protein B0J14DRAFT_306322 [Halenospora varia]|nr:hypothetical protein B0J14DRAFT_306322 [Halenospora varia]
MIETRRDSAHSMAQNVESGLPSQSSIQVRCEVSVVSHASHPPLPSIPNGDLRPISSSTSRSMRIAGLERWHTQSRASNKTVGSLRRGQVYRYLSGDGDKMVYKHRDNIRALSEFLKNTEPPPTSVTSAHAAKEKESGKRKSLITALFRSKSKKGNEPAHIMLPPTAILAMTVGGHRYIKIQTPTTRNSQELRPKSAVPSTKSLPTRHFDHLRETSGNVMKPFPPDAQASIEKSKDAGNLENDKERSTPAPEPLGVEATKTYLQYNAQNLNPLAMSPVSPTKVKRPRAFYTPYLPMSVSPSHSTKSEKSKRSSKRHSTNISTENSNDSNMAITAQAHSRDIGGVSAVSSNPSLGNGLLVPPRHSSLSKISKQIQQEFQEQSKQVNEGGKVQRRDSKAESIHSRTIASQSPQTVFMGTAETARSYSANLENIWHAPRLRSPCTDAGMLAHDQGLLGGNLSRPNTAPPGRAAFRHSFADQPSSTFHAPPLEPLPLDATLQNRPEKVKEQKRRDIENGRREGGRKAARSSVIIDGQLLNVDPRQFQDGAPPEYVPMAPEGQVFRGFEIYQPASGARPHSMIATTTQSFRSSKTTDIVTDSPSGTRRNSQQPDQISVAEVPDSVLPSVPKSPIVPGKDGRFENPTRIANLYTTERGSTIELPPRTSSKQKCKPKERIAAPKPKPREAEVVEDMHHKIKRMPLGDFWKATTDGTNTVIEIIHHRDASWEPYLGFVSDEGIPMPERTLSTRSNRKSVIAPTTPTRTTPALPRPRSTSAHTPPQSTSSTSSSPLSSYHSSSLRGLSPSASANTLKELRKAKREQRNKAIHERAKKEVELEMEKRLRRLEKDNAIITGALSGISRSVGQLRGLIEIGGVTGVRLEEIGMEER